MRTVSLAHPCTTTLPTMFITRKAPSMPSGIRRSIFFWAASGDASVNASIATITAVRSLRATSHLRRSPQQIHLLLVVRRQHFDQQLVRRIARQRVARLENGFVDGAQARLQLRDGLGRQHRLLLV